MNWPLLAQCVLGIFIVLSTLASLNRRPDWLLFLLPMALAFGGFNYYGVGTVWSPYKVVATFSLLYCILDQRWISALARKGFNNWWMLPLTVAIGTATAYYVTPPYAPVRSGSLQSATLRPLVQAFTYTSFLSIVPLCLLTFRDEKTITRFYLAYAFAGAVGVASSFLQLALYASGHEFMPILRMHGEHSSVAAFQSQGALIYRLYGFAGEPKQLGAFMLPLAIASIIHLSVRQSSARSVWWGRTPWTVAFVGVTVGTFSTAVIIALAGALFVGLPMVTSKVRNVLGIVMLLLLGGVAITLMTSLLIQRGDSSLLDTLQERSLGRLATDYQSRYETVALRYLFLEHLEYLPFGVGLGMFVFHLPGLHWGGGIQPIDSGWVTLLMDIGFLGTAIWVCLLGNLLIKGYSLARRTSDQRLALVLPAVGGLFAALLLCAGWGAMQVVMLWSGVLIASAHSNVENRNTVPMRQLPPSPANVSHPERRLSRPGNDWR